MSLRRQSVAAGLWTAGAYFQQDKKRRYFSPARALPLSPYYSSSLRIRSRCAMCLRQRGVMLAVMDGRIRPCTHLDVTAPMIEDTVGLVREIVHKA